MRGTQFSHTQDKYRHYVAPNQFSWGYKKSLCGLSTTNNGSWDILWLPECLSKEPCPSCVRELQNIVGQREASVSRSQRKLDMAREDVEFFKEGKK